MSVGQPVVKYGEVEIADSALVGPYCVLGFPSSDDRELGDLFSDQDTHVVSDGVRIGEKCCLLSHVVVGEGSVLESGVWCDHHTFIGCHTRIANGVEIMYGARIYDRVSIGKDSWIAGFICNDAVVEDHCIMLGHLIHRFVDAIPGTPESAPVIKKGAFVGMNATIIGGIEVGEGAYVAAGAVLTKDARPGTLYVGTPARNRGIAPKPIQRQKI